MRQLLILAFTPVALFCWTLPTIATDIYDGTYSLNILQNGGGTPLNIYGGTFLGDIQANDGLINILGGEFSSYITANGSAARIIVSGGSFHAQLGTNGGSLFIIGGEFESLSNTYAFVGASAGSVTFFGSDFALDGAPIPNNLFTNYGGGQLTGTLANGHPVNVPLINNQGEFHFVPEPNPSLLLAAGVFSLSPKRRRAKLK
jgi:hypothetical protein